MENKKTAPIAIMAGTAIVAGAVAFWSFSNNPKKTNTVVEPRTATATPLKYTKLTNLPKTYSETKVVQNVNAQEIDDSNVNTAGVASNINARIIANIGTSASAPLPKTPPPDADVVSSKAFTATSIDAVYSVMSDLDLSFTTFNKQEFYLGSELVLTQTKTVAGPGLSVSTNAALKIITRNGDRDQIINLRYRTNGKSTTSILTVCVPKHTTQATTLYVGKDGSTYTDSGYASRTTSEACSAIVARASRMYNFVNFGTKTTPWTRGDFTLSRNGGDRLLVQASGFYYAGPAATGEELSYGDPVAVRVSGLGNGPYTMPVMKLQVIGTQPTSTINLCYPGFTSTTSLPYIIYFYDQNGNPYSDIFLSKSVACTMPASIGLEASMIERVVSVSKDRYTHEIPALVFNQQEFYLGSTLSYTQTSFASLGTGTAIETDEPLKVVVRNGDRDQILNIRYKLAGQSTSLLLPVCVPKHAGSELTLYVGRDGSTYTDAKYTQRTMTEACGTFVNRALRIYNFSANGSSVASTPWTRGAFTFSRNSGDRMVIESSGFKYAGAAKTGEELSYGDPVAVNAYGINQAPYEMPVMRLVVAGVQPDATVTLCYPGFTATAALPYVPFFYDLNGQPYSDIFLTQSVACALP